MRYKCLAWLLLLSLLMTGCAPADPSEKMTAPVRFYYQPADPKADLGMGATPWEYRETAGHENDYSWILSEYLRGPVSQELMAPFRNTVFLESAALEQGNLELVLSNTFGELTGVDLTVACACVTLTCLELPGVQEVTISAQGTQLNGREKITLSAERFLREDLSGLLVERLYTLYFSDQENRYLIGEEMTLEGEENNVAMTLLEHLIAGPSGAGLAETMPVGTAVLSLGISDGVCSVNFSDDFLDYAPRSELSQRLTILSVTNTLTQLDDVSAVAFYVNGQILQSYGSLNLNQFTTYEERAIGPARTGLNELDLDLYLPGVGRETLSPIPVRIQQYPNEPATRLLLETLLAYEDQNGYHSPIPADTELLSLDMESGVCYIDFSAAFLSGTETELAVEAVSATILSGTDCKTVQVSVEGDRVASNEWHQDWISN